MMIKVDQTVLHSESTVGNCLRACVASILEIDIEAIPHVEKEIIWERMLNDWLEVTYGLRTLSLPYCKATEFWIKDSGAHYIMEGPSPRGKFWHAVVGKEGAMLHDPHPSRGGLVELKAVVFLVKK